MKTLISLACSLFVAGLLTSGCAQVSQRAVKQNINQERAVEIAKREATEGHGWKHFEVVNSRKVGESWRILLSCSPQYPGGHAIVIISAKSGEVLDWLRGL